MQKISDDEAWLVLLIIILQQDSSRVAKLWSDFESEIKYNNRFFPNTEILKEIEKLKEQSQYEEVKGTVLFRARLFKEDFLNYNKRDKEQLIEILCNHYPELKGKADDEINYYLTNMKDMLFKNDGLKDELRKVLKKRKRYWGYGPGDSDAPPTIVASDGRVNPRYISYLYLSTDVKTAILEVRPYVGQQVSVARVRLEKDLRLFNFCNSYKKNSDDMSLLSMISKLFSIPKVDSNETYYATQYICEYIKKLGFDGVMFQSSRNQGGNNIVLFDTKKDDITRKKNYTILSSKSYRVTDMEYVQIAPIQKKDS